MDAIAPKATSLASPKVVKNAKGNIIPSSQMAHIAYGCGMYLRANVCAQLTPAQSTWVRCLRTLASKRSTTTKLSFETSTRNRAS
jgi:hypothetical protein